MPKNNSSPQRQVTVMKRFSIACSFACALSLGGCSVAGWYSSSRDTKETRADLKVCDQNAQEAILARTHQHPATYGPSMPTPQPGNTIATGENSGLILGETPLQLHDRVMTEKTFDQAVSDCMKEKGYSQGRPKV